MRLIALAICTLATMACSSGTAPTSPTQYPDVAGTYTGSVTVSFPDLARSISCLASTAVTQSGATLNIAPIVLGGPCGNLSIPMGAERIDQLGALSAPATGTIIDTCGTSTYTASGGFFGRELRLSMAVASTTCPRLNFTAVLTR